MKGQINHVLRTQSVAFPRCSYCLWEASTVKRVPYGTPIQWMSVRRSRIPR